MKTEPKKRFAAEPQHEQLDSDLRRALADPLRMLRAKTLAKLLDVHLITIWHWSAEGKLPRPIKISAGTTVWRAGDIQRWLDEKAAS
jgi:prophage regulatory protein